MRFLYTIFIILSIQQIHAQVNFNISLLADQETYLVSLVSEKTITSPLNRVSNLQVVLKADLSNTFDDVIIESLIPGVDWNNGAYLEKPKADAPYVLYAISMAQMTTNAINFDAETETPLFTLKKGNGNCLGKITLPNNDQTEVLDALKNKLNFTQNISILGTRGNSFSGINNASINCKTTSIDPSEPALNPDIKAFPVPASNLLNIEWENSVYAFHRIQVFNNKGQIIKEIDINPSSGNNDLNINLIDFSSGIYSLRLIANEHTSTPKKFVVIK